MRKAEKYGDLTPRSKEYNRAAYFCKRYNLTYEEFASNQHKYTKLQKGRVKHKQGSREYKKWHYMLATYNLSEEDVESMLDKQDCKCAICEKEVTKDTCVVDHCHTTNKVRGLLCRMCNLGIGHFFDNEDLLISAAKYVKDSK